MTHRTTLSTLAFATVLSTLGFTVTASAQHRPSAGAHVPAQDGGGRISMDGRLGRRDRTDDEGRHRREQAVTLRRGDRVRFGVSSDALDVMAVVEGPGGQRWEDDDGAGGTDARLVFTAPRDGSYRFIVTSYEAGETGAYQAEAQVTRGGAATDDAEGDEGDEGGADVDEGEGDEDGRGRPGSRGQDDEGDADGADEPADPAEEPAAAATGAGTTYGIFVGISHYGGDNHDLPGSAADAVQLARTFQQAGWMQRHNAVVLTDAQATAGGVRQAFQALAPRVRPNDTLVFFFDGHGNRRELDLVGADITRGELGQMLNRVQGRQLLVLDSCEAGGFAPLVQGQANRAGLFSSRATESSSTAPQVGAGGWLAYLFRQAVAGEVRRRPDGSVDLNDVIAYVRRQYTEHRVTPEQNLVAVSDRRQGFSLGGRGDAVAPVATDTAVASRDPWRSPARRPGDVAMAPTAPAVPSMVPMGPTEGLFGNNDAFAQFMGAGAGVAGQVLAAMVK
ncbi:MAG: caspase family protein [Deltaproteobacteria bacterium]|nr:caspase family protein [Myxococcales bacterium]MDP3217870.1 caspase family protein [Deltaproteobacteria bacterium]